eukprot:14957289-Alexandrium_andersonii.AAC.1
MGGKRKRNEEDMSLLDSLWEAPFASDSAGGSSSAGSRRQATPKPEADPKPKDAPTKVETQKRKELQASERVVLEADQTLQLVAEGDGVLTLNVKKIAALESRIEK